MVDYNSYFITIYKKIQTTCKKKRKRQKEKEEIKKEKKKKIKQHKS